MSSIETKIVKAHISDHPNANRLSINTIGSEPGQGGFESVVGLNQFQNGDLVIYIMPDSVVPQNIQEHLAQNKITVKDGRIRGIKIRGVFSEGLCLKPSDWLEDKYIKEGKDVTEILGIVKYEPPERGFGGAFGGKKAKTGYTNSNFLKYDCVEKFKKCPGVLQLGEEVVVTKKYHGMNWRACIVKKSPSKKTWWQKIKGLFFDMEYMEFLVGSHNKIRHYDKKSKKAGYHKSDIFWKVAEKYDIENVINQIAVNEIASSPTLRGLPQVIIYGELVGSGIQKNYSYCIPKNDLEIRVFDIMIDREFLDWDRVKHICDCFNLPPVEEIYRGQWSLEVTKLAKAVDEYGGEKFVREGIVIKPIEERRDHKCGRVCFKYLNPEYLTNKKNTDFN